MVVVDSPSDQSTRTHSQTDMLLLFAISALKRLPKKTNPGSVKELANCHLFWRVRSTPGCLSADKKLKREMDLDRFP